MSARMLHKLATNPQLMLRYLSSGRMPTESRVTSPLIELLEGITPRDRARMRGVRISRRLGYLSTARFTTAEALLRWLKPFDKVVGNESWPAESCRDKAFRGPVQLAELLECCDVYPEALDARAKGSKG
jgi:hypothetical protein